MPAILRRLGISSSIRLQQLFEKDMYRRFTEASI